MKFVGIILTLAIAIAIACNFRTYLYLTHESSRVTNTNLVHDKETAIAIAEAIVESSYGKKELRAERPFRADYSNGLWRVRGSQPWLFKKLHGKGGVVVVMIRETDGAVIDLFHGK